MLKIADLLVTQPSLRNIPQILQMVDFVEAGGYWTQEALEQWAQGHQIRVSPLIYISYFPEDERRVIHDGHHRIAATWLAGREELLPTEYKEVEWEYAGYTRVNLECGYVTPFDPRTELRFADLKAFKDQARDLLAVNVDLGLEFIKNHKREYACERTLHTIAELCSLLDLHSYLIGQDHEELDCRGMG